MAEVDAMTRRDGGADGRSLCVCVDAEVVVVLVVAVDEVSALLRVAAVFADVEEWREGGLVLKHDLGGEQISDTNAALKMKRKQSGLFL